MTLTKRPNSRYWQADIPDASAPGGRRRVSTRETDKRAAEVVAARLLAAAPTMPVEGLQGVTIGSALADYLDYLQMDGKPSAATYATLRDKLLGRGSNLDRWCLDGQRRIDTLVPSDLTNLKRARLSEGFSPATIGNEIKALRSAVRRAVANGAKAPIIASWGVVEAPARERYLSPEEAAKVYALLDPNLPIRRSRAAGTMVPQGLMFAERQGAQDLFYALLSTGCRWSELTTLTWPQVHFGQGVISVRGKGGRTREVPIVTPLLSILMRRSAAAGDCPLVFPGRGGKQRAGRSDALENAFDAAGLNDPALVKAAGRVSVHTLRHTYASWLRQNGAGLDEVQRLLGHAKLATTARYAKVDGGALGKRVRSVLQDMLPA